VAQDALSLLAELPSKQWEGMPAREQRDAVMDALSACLKLGCLPPGALAELSNADLDTESEVKPQGAHHSRAPDETGAPGILSRLTTLLLRRMNPQDKSVFDLDEVSLLLQAAGTAQGFEEQLHGQTLAPYIQNRYYNSKKKTTQGKVKGTSTGTGKGKGTGKATSGGGDADSRSSGGVHFIVDADRRPRLPASNARSFNLSTEHSQQ